MKIIRTFYTNKIAYSAATIAYYNRVIADGGTVTDMPYVEECLNNLSLLGNVDGTWISPYFGNKVVNGKVVKAYSILSTDWIAADNSNVTIEESNGLYYHINNAPGLNTDTVNYFAKEYTYISKSSVQGPQVTVLLEYSRDKNQFQGFLLSFEAGYWCNTLSPSYSINSLSGIKESSVISHEIPRLVSATANLNKTGRQTTLTVEGVENKYPYVSPYGYLDNNDNSFTLQPHEIFLGSRNNTQFFADIRTSGVLLLNKELNTSLINNLSYLINKKYIKTYTINDVDVTSFLSINNSFSDIEKYAINNFVIQLKNLNLWDKFIAIYPIAGLSEVSHSYNLKNINTYRIDYINSPIHSKTGVQWDGQTQYGNTNCSFNDTASNDYGMSYYSRSANITGLASDTVDMGIYNTPDDAMLICTNNSGSGKAFARTPQNTLFASSNTIASGLFAVDRYVDGTSSFYKSAEILSTGNNSTNPAINLKVYLGNLNLQGNVYSNGYSNREFCYADIGRSLSDNERLVHYHLVQQLQFILSRQI